jgi:hypothetical protein
MNAALARRYEPEPGDNAEDRLVVVTDPRAFLSADPQPEWSTDRIHSIMWWAVMDNSFLKVFDCLLFVPDLDITSFRMCRTASNFQSSWSAFASQWSMGNTMLDLDVAFYHSAANRSEMTLHPFGYSDGVECRVNVFGYEFNFCLPGNERLMKALGFFTFDVSDFLSEIGEPQWDRLRSDYYNELVVIDDIDEGAWAIRV